MPRLLSSLQFLAFMFLMISAQVAQASDPVVRIEEDWYLRVGDPDPNVDGPQVSCVTSPRGHAEGLHAVLNLNHQVNGDFESGGLQLQIWNGEDLVATRNHPSGEILQTPGEVVRWTQRMEVSNGKLRYAVVNGSSTTWGAFGNQVPLTAETSTSLDHLNGYSPSVSLSHSGVVFAANRVDLLRLERIRVTTRSGETHTYSIEQNVQ